MIVLDIFLDKKGPVAWISKIVPTNCSEAESKERNCKDGLASGERHSGQNSPDGKKPMT